MKLKLAAFLLPSIIILAITLLLGEVSLRIFHHYYPTNIFYDTSYNRYRGKPFAEDWDFRLNSRGFKDKEFAAKKPHVYRIIAIGDSFTFGAVPYRHHYLTLLEEQLQGKGFHLEILNMGIPGLGPREYLSLLVNDGLDLKPDMVLLSFFIGNDFLDVGERKLYTYSYVASFLYYAMNVVARHQGVVVHGRGEYCDDCPSFDENTYLEIEKKRSVIYIKNNLRFQWLFRNAVYYLQQIQNVCRKHNIACVVVLIPDELQINPDLQEEVLRRYYPDMDRQKWQITLPNALLSGELNRLEIAHLDLYPHFAMIKGVPLYKPRDSHWNIAGNRLAAQVMADFLAARLPRPQMP